MRFPPHTVVLGLDECAYRDCRFVSVGVIVVTTTSVIGGPDPRERIHGDMSWETLRRIQEGIDRFGGPAHEREFEHLIGLCTLHRQEIYDDVITQPQVRHANWHPFLDWAWDGWRRADRPQGAWA